MDSAELCCYLILQCEHIDNITGGRLFKCFNLNIMNKIYIIFKWVLLDMNALLYA